MFNFFGGNDTILWFVILFLLLFWNNGNCCYNQNNNNSNCNCGCGCGCNN